ncbi:sugar kinase [Agromyces intestinalis]|uniref:sugar kinase n=1 Tax=Agromyces intestinalis TaxID=2592652 RepID=UPI001FEAC135|nr:sugar kinase [Agromyces intestinalis]
MPVPASDESSDSTTAPGRPAARESAAQPAAETAAEPAAELLAVGETMAMVAPDRAEPLDAAERFRIDAGGAESNVAAHVAALGGRAAWWSRLGDDALGRRIARQLAERGVEMRAEFDTEHPTGLYVKDPGRGVRYYRAGSAAAHLVPADADAVDLAGIRVLHVSGITAAISASAAEFLDRLIDRARAAGVLVSFDVNHRAALWSTETAAVALDALVRRAHLVFVGRDEAEALWGTATVETVRERFATVPELIVKDGEHGATGFAGDAVEFVPSPVIEVVEAVGAGDAFAGGYLAAMLAGAPLTDRLRAGHARAGITLQTTGDFAEEAVRA